MRVLNTRDTASTPAPLPNQNSLQLAEFLLSAYGNRFLFVGSNYIYPYESNRLMARLRGPGQGQGPRRNLRSAIPRAEGFRAVIARIKKTSPDVIFSTVVGSGTSTLLQKPIARPVRSDAHADCQPDHQRGRSRRDGARGRGRTRHRRRPSSRRCRRRRRAASSRVQGRNTVPTRRSPPARKRPIFSFIWRCARSESAAPTNLTSCWRTCATLNSTRRRDG